MDRFSILRALDRVALGLRRAGLGRLTRAGKLVIGRLMDNRLFVNVEGLYLWGAIEHREYLFSLREGRRESFMLELFKASVGPGMVVLDIGAYVGAYSLFAAARVGPRGSVWAFEPDPLNFKALRRNVEMNGFDDIIHPVQVAVSNRKGSTRLFLSDYDRSTTSLFVAPRDAAQIQIESVTLDDFLPRSTIVGIIKMDMEGAELAALDGMAAILSRRADGLKLFVECNPSALRAAGRTPHELLSRLEALGLQVMVIDEHERRLLQPDLRTLEASKYVNLYCAPRGSVGLASSDVE
jgi:FkbM family methyltransferase